jgi:hypothetical protein
MEAMTRLAGSFASSATSDAMTRMTSAGIYRRWIFPNSFSPLHFQRPSARRTDI